MNTLDDVLNEFKPTVDLGGAKSPSDKLLKRLRDVNAANSKYFIICVAMVVAMFVAALSLIFLRMSDSTTATLVAGAFGLSVAGMVRMMLRLWREKVATDLLLELSNDPAVLRSVIDTLATRLK